MKLFKIIVFILLFQFCLVINKGTAKEIKNTSIYMWETDGINYSAYDEIVDYLNINKIYAYIGTKNISTKIGYNENLLFAFAQSKKISTYIIYDENYIDQNENLNRIKELIDEVYEYNKNASYKIKGISTDSEFHTLDGYSELSKNEQVQLFKNYVNTMKIAYLYAKEHGIEFIVCIPTWLDKLDKDTLEDLIKNGCDYVQLMNYTKTGMINNIKDEIVFAKKYNKPIENIAELQKPGKHDVTDEITFYNDGIIACNNKFKEIAEYYDYDILTFSYHYLKPITELTDNILDYNNKYNYELYLKNDNEQTINIKNAYLKNENQIIKSINFYNKNTNEYINYFYGLEFDKTYNLIIDDSAYEIKNNKSIIYNKSNDNIKYDEVYLKLKEQYNNTVNDDSNNDNIVDNSSNNNNIVDNETNNDSSNNDNIVDEKNNDNKVINDIEITNDIDENQIENKTINNENNNKYNVSSNKITNNNNFTTNNNQNNNELKDSNNNQDNTNNIETSNENSDYKINETANENNNFDLTDNSKNNNIFEIAICTIIITIIFIIMVIKKK